LRVQLLERSLIPQHSIDQSCAFVIAHLCGQARSGVLLIKTSQLTESTQRRRRIDLDGPDLIEVEESAMFRAKKRYRHEDDSRLRRVELPDDLAPDRAVRYVIQSAKRTGIVKHDVSDKFSIELVVGAEYGGAERVAQRDPRWFTWFDDPTGDVVRVNYGPPERREALRDGRLPRADTTRDGNSFHTTTVLIGTHTPIGARCE
jgi:hypothetical protein